MNNGTQRIPAGGKNLLNIRATIISKRHHVSVFIVISLVFLSIAFLYFYNLLQWSYGPDFGWAITDQMEKIEFVEVYGEAERAGLKVGDKIISVNNTQVRSYEQLQQHLIREAGRENIYEVDRNGQIITATVLNRVLGFDKAFLRFGLTWVLGIIFFILGGAVFFMKPGTLASWGFLMTMFNAGLYITFSFTSKLLPEWLDAINIFALAFLPGSLLHLAQTVPVERSWIKKNKLFLLMPYMLSFVLLIIMRFSAKLVTDIPVVWKQIALFYSVFSILAFLFSVSSGLLKSAAVITRMRSRIILMGVILSAGFPLLDNVMTLFFGYMLITSPVLNLPFYLFLPIFTGYSIAKHNLFDVDVYIKRAVGYGFMTVLVGAIYFTLQISMRTALLKTGFGEYTDKIYPVVFAVLIVFLFNPINRSVQKGVDKLFFRKRFDYKETIIKVSDALTSVLDLSEVIRKIIFTVRAEMFIDTAGVIMLEPQKKECQTLFVSDDPDSGKNQLKEKCIPYDDPLLSLIAKEKKVITLYDVLEDPSYEDVKEPCSQRFTEMGASVLLPLIYKDTVTGALALGFKKSGHFYTREDIDLLNTLANHGAVAIENARLVDKIKREEIVRTNLSRYLSPQIVEHIIKKDVEVNLGGDKRVVTVLFMDIIGFTSLSERLQPEEIVSLLNEYFTEMSKAIFRWEGTLDKFAGDQIMAFWGAPTRQPDHAERAVRCAMNISKMLDELQERWRKEGKPVFDCGIGINTGEVLVGNIGVEGMKMDYTVIGDTVNLASRVEKLTRQYKSRILITEFTMEHIRESVAANKIGNIKLTDLAHVKVKGKEQGVRIYKLEITEGDDLT